jgi:hypothetical protein
MMKGQGGAELAGAIAWEQIDIRNISPMLGL